MIFETEKMMDIAAFALFLSIITFYLTKIFNIRREKYSGFHQLVYITLLSLGLSFVIFECYDLYRTLIVDNKETHIFDPRHYLYQPDLHYTYITQIGFLLFLAYLITRLKLQYIFSNKNLILRSIFAYAAYTFVAFAIQIIYMFIPQLAAFSMDANLFIIGLMILGLPLYFLFLRNEMIEAQNRPIYYPY